MPFKRLASFPVSRVKIRPPTREAETMLIDLGEAQADVPFLIIAGREDRTRLTIMNKTNQTLVYGYSDSETEGPTSMEGTLEAGIAIDTDSPQSIWGKYSVLPSTGRLEIDEGIG